MCDQPMTGFRGPASRPFFAAPPTSHCRIPSPADQGCQPPRPGIGHDPWSHTGRRSLGNLGTSVHSIRSWGVRILIGLTHGSKLDREVSDDFHDDWSALVAEASARSASDRRRTTTRGDNFISPRRSFRTNCHCGQGLHQAFFLRESVLSSYNGRCCITALPVPECLVAGHIIPWSVDERKACRSNERVVSFGDFRPIVPSRADCPRFRVLRCCQPPSPGRFQTRASSASN